MTADQPTPAELRTLRAYVAVGSMKEAAAQIGIAESTVKVQLASIRSKLGVRTTAQAVYLLHDRIAA